jgi:hypothetical protein
LASLLALLLLSVDAGCRTGDAPVDAPGPTIARVAAPGAAAHTPPASPPKGPGPGRGDDYPLQYARDRGTRIDNREAPIPIQCYTKTAGESNPCWACHTDSTYPNLQSDAHLQAEYSFSAYGTRNRWSNAFIDRSAAIAAIDDDTALAWVRQDNYSATREILADHVSPWAYPFDLDYHGGFDDEGFARDGSAWRAFRYKPFVGTFWPTNGSTDDVLVRLPRAFRELDGHFSAAVYKANLALLEASLASDPWLADAAVDWPTEALDERVVALDLDGDGVLGDAVARIRGLPDHYVGDAAGHPLSRGVYPEGTEFLHSVRYLDPDAPGMTARRFKELRYMHKEKELPRRRYFSAYEQEANDKEAGVLPTYGGNAETGLLGGFGWRLQGYIEDGEGRLRLQSYEEHYACMGCHTGIGVTADGTFSLARKVPGAAGWGYQRIDDLPDVPQVGHADPEVLTYLRRVGGGDELRANDEMLARFFDGGRLDEAEVRRAAPGGDLRLPDLVAPSRERALQLDKAYMVLMRAQSFELGRDAMLAPPQRVHTQIDDQATGLREAHRTYRDGTLRLDWSATPFWRG